MFCGMTRRARTTDPHRPIALPRTTTADRRVTSTDVDCFGMIVFAERNAAASRNELTISVCSANMRTSATAIVNLESARALFLYLDEFITERDEPDHDEL